jgi:hypothetical protein
MIGFVTASGNMSRPDPHEHGGRLFLAAEARHRGVHHVGKGQLHRYCTEFEFRYNTRMALGYTDGERAALIVRGSEGKRLTYKQPPDTRAN